MNEVALDSAKASPNIETKLNHENIIRVLQDREELPPAYLLLLKGLDLNESRDGIITLKILRLYIYARSKFRGDTKNIKAWLQTGTLPSEKFGTRQTMVILYKKLRLYSNFLAEKVKLEKEIGELTNGNSGDSKKEKDRKFKGLLSKEFKSSDIDSRSEKTLNEILVILDKFETLIAPRSDQ